MGTSIKLHNKTLDKTSAIVSPDNQTEDLEIKLPNKNGTLATTDDLGTATNEERVVEIINKTVSENKDTVEKVVENIGEFRVENKGKEVDGLYTAKNTVTGKHPFIRPLEQTLTWSVGEGTPPKGSDAHYATLKEALQEASYYTRVFVNKYTTPYTYTNTTQNDVIYKGNKVDEVIKPGQTKKMTLELYMDTLRQSHPNNGIIEGDQTLTGQTVKWGDDFNRPRIDANFNVIYIILQAGYIEKDYFHISWGSQIDLSHVVILSMDGNLLLDVDAIVEKRRKVIGPSARYATEWWYQGSGASPYFWGLHIKPKDDRKIGSFTSDGTDDAGHLSRFVPKGENRLHTCFNVRGAAKLSCSVVKMYGFIYGIIASDHSWGWYNHCGFYNMAYGVAFGGGSKAYFVNTTFEDISQVGSFDISTVIFNNTTYNCIGANNVCDKNVSNFVWGHRFSYMANVYFNACVWNNFNNAPGSVSLYNFHGLYPSDMHLYNTKLNNSSVQKNSNNTGGGFDFNPLQYTGTGFTDGQKARIYNINT